MKKNISLALILATSTLFVGCDKLKGVSQQPQPAPQTQQTSNQATPNPQQAPAHQAPAQQDPMLMVFNQSVKLTAMSRSIVLDENKNEGSLVVYRLDNVSKKPITSVVWTTAFTVNDQVFNTSNVTVNLEKQPLQPNTSTEVRALDLFKTMPEQVQAIFKNPNQKLNVLFVAREVTFADGSKVIVSE
ncbi:MAG: hypothetical protein SOW21_06350 [[Actinobacillus] rossii]|uniref:Lipoprotein n=1 Tax=[Actinobacillus] rossii TaxID=123820 RepID=A0A380TU58_9PAST|nr:hypothetical protein [[Actinobacillus] rossii]MDY3123984.1 hypothetical protein [[Actinobacillus] rossii]SUT91108.1 Uncharacterised protein [[Actinobacillus] rossii]